MSEQKKRILIVGASALQVPMILRAKELGFTVAVADMNPNAVGIPYADCFFCVSTIDAEGICEAARAFGAQGITTVATDMPMRAIAYAGEKLGLKSISPDTALKTTDKGEMIRAFEAHGVAHPWFYILENPGEAEGLAGQITYPCISKPTDNSGSRGVALIRSPEELEEALAYSSSCGRTGRVILEEYLSGPEVSVEAFATEGTCHILAVTDKLTTGAPHFVELGHTQPTAIEPAGEEAIRALAAAAMKAVGIENGPAHIEIMLTADGPKMIELGARMGGDFITTDLVPLSTGVDMLGATILLSCGETPDVSPKFREASAVRYFQAEAGVIRAIRGVAEAEAVPGVCRVELFRAVGDTVGGIENSADRTGCIIARGADRAQAVAACERALQLISVETE